jgi:Tol biopolymer transport system component/DNA-binding winged helix-turn-helix (wHTH) protein
MLQINRDLFTFGPFVLNPKDRLLHCRGTEVKLRPRAFDLLVFFVANPQVLLSRDDIVTAVWKVSSLDRSAVDARIKEIRDALAEHDPAEYIRTQHGHGWRFVAPVTRPDITPSAPSEPLSDSSGQAAPEPRRMRRRSWQIAAVLAAGSAIVFAILLRPVDRSIAITRYRQLTNDAHEKLDFLILDGGVLRFKELVDSVQPPAAVPVTGGDVGRGGPVVVSVARSGDPPVRAEEVADGFQVMKAETVLASVSGGEFPSIAPDGSAVAYVEVRNQSALVIRNLKGNANERRVGLPGLARNSVWSPDGQRIRFTVRDGGLEDRTIWEVARDGSHLRHVPLPDGEGTQLDAGDWSRDGRYFIYSRFNTATMHSNIWVVPVGRASETPVQLTDGPIDFSLPVFSKDGSTVFAIGSKVHEELARFDSGRRDWVPFWDGLAAIDIDFHRGGKAAFIRWPERTLWVSNADGLGSRQLTFEPMEAHQPHWSPDGSKIAFMGKLPDKLWRIYTVPSSGGAPRELRPEDSFDQGVPTWSPDGRRVAFGELRLRRPDNEMQIHVFDLATRTEATISGSIAKWSARWSPDGRYIAATGTDFRSVHLYDIASKQWTMVFQGDIVDNDIWSPDSSFLQFSARSGAGPAIFRIYVPSRKVETTTIPGVRDPQWSGMAPDGSPLILRNVIIEEIYAIDWKRP